MTGGLGCTEQPGDSQHASARTVRQLCPHRRQPAAPPAAGTASSRDRSGAIRAWAKDDGIAVSSHQGRLTSDMAPLMMAGDLAGRTLEVIGLGPSADPGLIATLMPPWCTY